MDKEKHPPEITEFINNRSHLFWWIPENDKEHISLNALVEAVLNYGDDQDVKGLFQLLGTRKVADIYYQGTKRSRVNFHKRTINYFNLYFSRHA